MSVRDLAETSVENGAGQRVKALEIVCAQCTRRGYFPHMASGIRKPPLAAIQHFQREGWSVGSSHRKDLCPACANPPRKEKPMPQPANTSTVVPLKADEPRQMSREDRRIINDKLDEVYAKDSYKQPWTDAAVAKDLGVPRQWVEDVREQFFGPAGSNPLFDDYLARVAQHADGLKEFDRRLAEFRAMHADIDTWRTNLSKQADEIFRIGKRIEKELGR